MANKTEWKVGDKCPNDGGELRPVPAPTDADRTAARDRDNPVPLRPGVDTATEQQIAELGSLYRCPSCGYQARAKGDAGAGDRSGAQSAGQANTRGGAGAASQPGAGAPPQPSGQAGATGGGDEHTSEIDRLRAENARLRAGGGGQG